MQARNAKHGIDGTRKAVSIDVEYFYAYVSFPPRRIIYENSALIDNEMKWTHPGGLIESNNDLELMLEPLAKKYADGFGTHIIEESMNKRKLMVFPRFKTLQTYSVACYLAFNDTSVEERHIRRLAHLESAIAGMRELLIRGLKTNPLHSMGPPTLFKALEFIRVAKEDIAAIRNTHPVCGASEVKTRKLRDMISKTS
ncbi:hypothetical protein HPB50_011395 [Hyalomma asiaticum]|uniref:Uncharacterized protein n=1 Tax=Hyalomma asiaticum TaxID=266040 RepID=A0ACB7S6N0_HYAAI|nr:hypothetical protein HPB50_011395 [Hyalomma asiaticum]